MGLGATPSETTLRVLLPATFPNLMAAFLLSLSRAVGETMIVVMAAGQELAQGKPQEVLRQPAVIEAYLGKSNVTAGHQ